MSVRLDWQGLSEFRKALRQLPEDLAVEAGAIVETHARFAQQTVQQAYPTGPTGNLKRGVTIDTRNEARTKFGAISIVRSRSKHSSIFERGTVQRRTSRGYNRGSMPVAPEGERMIPIVVRRRRLMVEALKTLVRKAGFQVE